MASTDIKWATTSTPFRVYINPKTMDSTELDLIVELYRQDIMLPAFYQIYLIDESNNILRTV